MEGRGGAKEDRTGEVNEKVMKGALNKLDLPVTNGSFIKAGESGQG